jgi:hypothetical protein
MIVKENLNINSKAFVRTFSDAGFMIERDGQIYAEALDLAYLGREYTETDIPIEPADDEPQKN